MCIAVKNIFLQSINRYEGMKNLTKEQKTKRIKRIMKDMEEIGIFDEDDNTYYDDLEFEAEVKFHGLHSDKEESEKTDSFKETSQNLQAERIILQRIQEKRKELSSIPELNLDCDDDFEEELMEQNYLRYGRSPLHEAIAMEDFDHIEEYISQGKYIEHKDNNGDTPYLMALQDRNNRVLDIFKKYNFI